MAGFETFLFIYELVYLVFLMISLLLKCFVWLLISGIFCVIILSHSNAVKHHLLTFLAFPGPAMNADMSNSLLLTTGSIFMCSSSTPEKLLMLSRSSTRCTELILVRSASRITVSTVTGSSSPHMNGWTPSSAAAWLDSS